MPGELLKGTYAPVGANGKDDDDDDDDDELGVLFLISFVVFLTSDGMIGGSGGVSGLVFFCECVVLGV